MKLILQLTLICILTIAIGYICILEKHLVREWGKSELNNQKQFIQRPCIRNILWVWHYSSCFFKILWPSIN